MTTYIFLEHFFGRVVPHAVSLSQLALSVAFVTSPAGTPPRVPSLPLSFHAKLSIQHGHYPAQEDSRGGLTSKIHVVVDGNGLPVRLGLTGGQVHDNRLCSVLLQQLPRRARLLADRGYDADWIRAFVTERGAWANIPPKSNRKNPICFSPISQPGGAVLQQDQAVSSVATRYGKLAANYLAFVKLACIRLRLRVYECTA